MPTDSGDAEAEPERPALHYFHGTRAPFKRGDVLRPRREHGGVPTNAPTVTGERHPDSDDWVHVTTRFLLAWAYAHESGGSGDPVVLVVEPQGGLEPDPEHSDWMKTYRCESAKVLAVDDEPAITAEEAKKHWKPAIEDLNDLPTVSVRRPPDQHD